MKATRISRIVRFADTLPLTPRFEDERRLFKWCSGSLSTLIVGSDEVWKWRFGRHEELRPPPPNAYWPGDIGVRRIAYAASIGDSDTQQIPAPVRADLEKRIEGFELVTVRDNRTADFIRSLGRRDVELAPDPVWAINLATVADRRLADSAMAIHRRAEKPVALLLSAAPECLAAAKRAVDLGYRVLAHGNSAAPAAIEVDPTPPEWIGLLWSCDLVISNRMHPLIVSAIGGVPCVSTDTRPKTVELRRLMGVPESSDPAVVVNEWPAAQIQQLRAHYARRHEALRIRIRSMAGG